MSFESRYGMCEALPSESAKMTLLKAERDLLIACASLSVCQHTSAYVSIRQHTSAYVSIRERLVDLERLPYILCYISVIYRCSILYIGVTYIASAVHTLLYIGNISVFYIIYRCYIHRLRLLERLPYILCYISVIYRCSVLYIGVTYIACASLSVCQHTSAYVSQRTSAYVSIRQHRCSILYIDVTYIACASLSVCRTYFVIYRLYIGLVYIYRCCIYRKRLLRVWYIAYY